MLGLQDSSRTDGALPSKTYRCMACAATFPMLSSLLVHQASHASDASPLDELQPSLSSPEPSCTSCGVVFATTALLDLHHCSSLPLPASPTNFLCTCGEQFQHYSALLDHKKLHTEGQALQEADESSERQEEKRETEVGAASSLPDQTDPTPSTDKDGGLLPSSTQDAPDMRLIPLLATDGTSSEAAPREVFSALASPQSGYNSNPLVVGQSPPTSVSEPAGFGTLPAFTMSQDPSLNFGLVMGSLPPSSVPSSSSSFPVSHRQSQLQSQKKTLKKVLLSEFMKCLPPAQLSWNCDKGLAVSKKTMSAAAAPALTQKTSVSQLRRLLSKSASQRKASCQASAILNMISSHKPPTKRDRRVICMNKTFLPVVALVTRQKLVGFGREDVGRHQCGRCRRIFQDVDSLILHHTVHRKERVYGCRRCAQLLISRGVAVGDHVCPLASSLSSQVSPAFSVGNVLPSASSTQPHPNQQQGIMGKPFSVLQGSSSSRRSARIYHCSVCRHDYTRLYNLKKHRCPGMAFLQEANRTHPVPMKTNTKRKLPLFGKPNEITGDELLLMSKSVGVGTDGPPGIKLEAADAFDGFAGSVTGVSSCSPKSFPPFLPKSTPKALEFAANGGSDVIALDHASVPPDDLGRDRDMVGGGDELRHGGGGQWTMPIDDSEIDKLIEAEDHDDSDDITESIAEDSIDSTQNHSRGNQMFQAGGKCFSCNHCGRGYTRHFTLQQHLKKCHPGLRAPVQQHFKKHLKVSKDVGEKQRFSCLRCGRSFSYRDTLVLHQKSCLGLNSKGKGSSANTGAKKSNVLAGQAHAVKQGRLFVLPPSPQGKGTSTESKNPATGGDWGIMSLPSVLPRRVTCECGAGFTCPRLLFEHLQSHAQESYICPDCGETLQSWLVFEAHLRTHQRTTCQKCNQTFRHRYSLQRHLSRNRCPGEPIDKKKHGCPLCKMTLPSAHALKRHQQNSTCKPSRKLIRCPVCTYAFGSLEGLQKHLISHTHPNAFRCQLCQRSYPSLRSLKDHRRKVHRVLIQAAKSPSQEPAGVVSLV
ncbi:hypothetical protein JZ751_007401 [Albula glossodonta]|uniref:C2H2-type domain-containing protein n=1 Tax=Albula glossodonta TaxID=121402 RepID=A0A8T2N599_9TELE|nr:hypothetical protein JZ751_007401 [Albula glossodonta]